MSYRKIRYSDLSNQPIPERKAALVRIWVEGDARSVKEEFQLDVSIDEIAELLEAAARVPRRGRPPKGKKPVGFKPVVIEGAP